MKNQKTYIQKALNLTPEKFQEQYSNIDVLADYGYFSYEQVEKEEKKENTTLYMPDKGLASENKDKLRRPSDRKKNNKKRYGKDDMTWDEKNHCYLCPKGQILEQKKIYHLENRDKITYYGANCSNCPSKDKYLSTKMTTKVITDYVSDSTMKLKHRMHTPEAQEKYKDRMPNVEPRFAYNKYTLKYRQYHVKGQKSAITQQLFMATAQNMIKIHNIEQNIQKENTIPLEG